MRVTEKLHDKAIGLDARPTRESAALLAEGQIAASATTRTCIAEICAGAEAMATTIQAGGVLHYVAAGSSGLMAAADALELGGTYSIPPSQIRIHMAGGVPQGVEMPGDTEDATDSLATYLSDLSDRDTVIAVSASGSTPYTIAAAKAARAADASVVGIANNRGSELLTLSQFPVLLETPPEVISGSTRMGAGTAQKIALNMLSTLMAIHLGHVHDGRMVNLHADNTKLLARARGIVADIAEVSPDIASDALAKTDGNIKCAILLAAGANSPDHARLLIEETGGHLRPALERLN